MSAFASRTKSTRLELPGRIAMAVLVGVAFLYASQAPRAVDLVDWLLVEAPEDLLSGQWPEWGAYVRSEASSLPPLACFGASVAIGWALARYVPVPRNPRIRQVYRWGTFIMAILSLRATVMLPSENGSLVAASLCLAIALHAFFGQARA